MLTRLVLTLAMLTPPSQEAADAAFNAGDYARALEMFEERAADPAVHLPDAVGGARDSLLALYAETGDAAHLCRARDLDRDLLAREVFADASERLGWVETEAKDVAKIDAAGVVCLKPPEPQADAPDAEAPPAPSAKGEGPAPLPRNVALTRDDKPQVWRRGVGIGLVAGAGASLLVSGAFAGMSAFHKRGLRGLVDEIATSGGRTWRDDLLIDVHSDGYNTYRAAAIGFGVVAGACLGVGTGLLIWGRKHPRSSGRASLTPFGGSQSGGLTLAGRF